MPHIVQSIIIWVPTLTSLLIFISIVSNIIMLYTHGQDEIRRRVTVRKRVYGKYKIYNINNQKGNIKK